MMKSNQLFLAAMKLGTHALGPGYRAVIWVQGCPFHCKGCISPEWILPGGVLTDIEDIARRILDDPAIEGLTISGGEPMQQASPLYRLTRILKRTRRDFNVICFTGYRFQDLMNKPPSGEVRNFLNEIDVLIDGPYIAAKNDNIGLRGSSNQTIHFLSEALREHDFEHNPRKIEIELNDGEAFIVGIPPRLLNPAWDQAMVSILRR
jgi:anaerobic ribonucleoside-triphosphate reductase activating protein